MHGNCVLRLHAHAKRLPTPDVPLFWLACGHGTTAALRVIIAILLCKTGCVAACRVSAVLPYVVSTVVGSAGRCPLSRIRKFTGLAKAQELNEGKGASLRRPTGTGMDLGGSLLTKLVLDPNWPGPGSAQSKSLTRLSLHPAPGNRVRRANACRGLLPGNSSGAPGPLVIGGPNPILCVAPWLNGRGPGARDRASRLAETSILTCVDIVTEWLR